MAETDDSAAAMIASGRVRDDVDFIVMLLNDRSESANNVLTFTGLTDQGKEIGTWMAEVRGAPSNRWGVRDTTYR